MLNKTLLPTLAIVIGLSFVVTGDTPVSPPDLTTMRATLDGTEYKIDGAHSSLLFRIRHLDSAYFYGRFNKMKGSFKIDDADLGSSFVNVEVKTGDVDGANRGRNAFLRGADLLAAKEFPKISFKSSSVVKKADDLYTLSGKLSFRGVTKSITFDAKHTGTATVNPRFGIRRGFLAEIPIKRSDYGMKYGIDTKVLGDEVLLIVSLEGAAAAK